MPGKLKFGRCKKMSVDDVPFLVVKLPKKVPGKMLRDLKKEINSSVDLVNMPTESKE